MLTLFINIMKLPKRNFIITLSSLVLLNACVSTGSVKEDNTPVAPQAQADYQRAVSAMKSGQTKRAFNLFININKKYPGFAGPQLNIGLLYLKSNNLAKAEKAFKQAIQINRDNAVGYNLLGVVYRRSGKFLEAKEAYLQALSKNSEYANAHLNLGILYDLYMNNLNRALHHYQQYQTFNGTADKKVAKWILDLKRRAKSAQTSTTTSRGGNIG